MVHLQAIMKTMYNRQPEQMTATRAVKIGLLVIGALLVCYAISRFIPVLRGPRIMHLSTTITDEAKPGFVTVQGITKNTESLTMNDAPVVPAIDGGFEVTLVVPWGYNVFTFTAVDKFDKVSSKTITLYVDEPPDVARITTPISPVQDPPDETDDGDNETNEEAETLSNVT